jgi:hypothetical protein
MGKETRYVTKLFKNYNVDIAWHTNNSLEQHLSMKTHKGDPYNCCGIYKLICQCGGAYVGLTGRKFRTRYKEHVRDIRSNKDKNGIFPPYFKYRSHVWYIRRYSQNSKDTKKGPHLKTLERFYVYKENKIGLLLNDTYTDEYNPLFELVTSVEEGGGQLGSG